MTLAAKLFASASFFVVVLLLLGGASLWGLLGLRGYFAAAEDEYQQLRVLYEAGFHAASARLLVNAGAADRVAVQRELHAAIGRAESLLQGSPTPPTPARQQMLQTMLARLKEARDATRAPNQRPALNAAPGANPQLTAINAALRETAALAQRIQGRIVANRTAAAQRLWTTVAVMTTLTVLAAVGATGVGYLQYMRVMKPLRGLERGVIKTASGDFGHRLPVQGDREFAQVTAQFNRMARELASLYDNLEQQVQTKTKQLLQSQRLAGVGYLAAGVAHEINNPLSIIAGHAEAALTRLERRADRAETSSTPHADTPAQAPAPMTSDAPIQRATRALQIICEESFRCKQIVDHLLTLARPGDGVRSRVSLPGVCRRVVALLEGLPQYRGKTIRLADDSSPDTDANRDIVVIASEAELTQVLLNLLDNALNAAPAGDGCVTLQTQVVSGWAQMRIIDNGVGMDQDTLQRVFDPFFTARPPDQTDKRGTGLGLAVSHAIIQQHGGRLHAHSDGPGRGSVFTVELPVVGESLAYGV